MFLVVGHLDGTAAPRLGNSFVHRIRRLVGIHDDLAVCVSCRAANRLDERTVVAQKAFLIGIEDGHKRHLGQVEALAQEIDAYKRVELAAPERTENLDALERSDVGVHVARFQTVMSTRSFRAARSFASSMMSSIWLALERTMISGSSKPVGRMICSTVCWLTFSS